MFRVLWCACMCAQSPWAMTCIKDEQRDVHVTTIQGKLSVPQKHVSPCTRKNSQDTQMHPCSLCQWWWSHWLSVTQTVCMLWQGRPCNSIVRAVTKRWARYGIKTLVSPLAFVNSTVASALETASATRCFLFAYKSTPHWSSWCGRQRLIHPYAMVSGKITIPPLSPSHFDPCNKFDTCLPVSPNHQHTPRIIGWQDRLGHK